MAYTSSSFTTSSLPKDDAALNAILEPFGFNLGQLYPVLARTSAAMAGGAVTHYLATRDPSLGFGDLKLPPSSDLDFWVCNPIPSTSETFYARRAFSNLVAAEFMRLLAPLGFNYDGTCLPPKSFAGCEESHGDYLVCREQFKAQGDIKINVHWITNRQTKRVINLIFTDKSIATTISKFDFPITFAYIYCTGNEFLDNHEVKIAYDSRVLEDLKDRQLSPPDSAITVPTYTEKEKEVMDKRRANRARKYMDRYGLVARGSVDDCDERTAGTGASTEGARAVNRSVTVAGSAGVTGVVAGVAGEVATQNGHKPPKKLTGGATTAVMTPPTHQMASSTPSYASAFTSSYINASPLRETKETKALDAILEPFGLKGTTLAPLLFKTSAVMAGGAATHLVATWMAGRKEPLPSTSDLDFWVFRPIPNTLECLHPRRVFNDLVAEEFMRVLKPLGFELFNSPIDRDGRLSYQNYSDCKEEFKTQGGVEISVKWLLNKATKRLINLIFTDKPIAETVSKFDLPISRAFVYGRAYGNLILEYDRRVLQDLKDGMLSTPDPLMAGKKTEEHGRKYMDRYGLVARDSVTVEVAAVPEEVAAVPEEVASVAPLSVEIPPISDDCEEAASHGSPRSPRKKARPATHPLNPLPSLPAIPPPDSLTAVMNHMVSKLSPSDPLIDEFLTKMEDLVATLKKVKVSMDCSTGSTSSSAAAAPPTVAEVKRDFHQDLMLHVRENNLAKVEFLLDEPSVDSSLNNNEALLVACDLGYVAMVDRLLNHGDSSGTRFIDPSKNDNEALRLAAAKGHQEIVELLMKHPRVKASVNAVPVSAPQSTLTEEEKVREWHRVLMNDIELGYLLGVKRLLENPLVDPSRNDNEAIRLAASKGYREIVELLMADPRVDPSANDNEALRLAGSKGYASIVDLLLRDPRVFVTGAPLNIDPAVNHERLMTCVKTRHVAGARSLMERGVDPSANNNEALRLAVQQGDTEMVTLLQADPRVTTAATAST